MKIDATRAGGSGVLRLGGRLDREGADYLSNTLEDLLRHGVRSLTIDLSGVTYISSAATKVLTRWHQELAGLRGEVELTSLPPAVRETLAIAGWDWHLDAADGPGSGPSSLRQSSWQLHAGSARSGEYQVSASVPEGTLSCRLHGHPDQLTQALPGPDDCDTVAFPDDSFGLGLGAIGATFEQCQERLGELVAVAGCVAYFPSDGARMADYLVGDGPAAPQAVLASGLSCQGSFSKLVRFGTQSEAEAIPFSELAAICLEAAGGKVAGLVIAGETAGLSGARLRRSPAADAGVPVQLDLPEVRDWLSFAPERTYAGTTALVAGVVARRPEGLLAKHLRPLGLWGQLYGHFHAAVFSYHPLPQRTVELRALLRGLFRNHQLRDVLHLLWDDRGEAGVGESALVRGVCWVSPITQIS
jgi:anti-anti-sigma factor